MPARDLNQHDPLEDFEHRPVTLQGQSKLVFVGGSGPAVIVMTEMPGIYPLVARFARRVRDAGFTVWMPNLFGDPGRPRVRLAAGAGITAAIPLPLWKASILGRPTQRVLIQINTQQQTNLYHKKTSHPIQILLHDANSVFTMRNML